MKLTAKAEEKARRVRMFLLHVDGDLSDGRLTYQLDGTELKTFHSHDGVGIRLAQKAGIEIGVITGRRSDAVKHRCTELGMTEIHQGNWQKLPIFEEILARRGLSREEVAFVGDDLPDLPVLRRVGFALTVPDARPEVLEVADASSERIGGNGAVREILEALIKAQGKWDNILASYEPGKGSR